jgi:hypothetical protein
MAGYIPNAYRAVLLEALAGRTATSTATLYLGLATNVPDNPLESTLANIAEVTTAGYARKSIPAFAAASTVSPVQITVPTEFQFAAFTADQAEPANYAFITAAATGTGSPIRYIFQLTEPVRGLTGVPIVIPASTLIIE